MTHAGPRSDPGGSAKAEASRLFYGIFRRGLAVACLVALPLATWSAEPETEDAAAEDGEKAGTAPATPARISARLRLEYEYKEQGPDSDSDFYGRLYSNARDLQDGQLDVYLSARLHTDFDETTTRSLADDPFVQIEDTKAVTEDRLLQLYGDLHTRDRKLALRGGRQYIEVADYLQLDGGQLMVNERGTLGGRVYAGHPVSYYTSVSEDYAVGGSLVGRPFEGNQSRLTYSRYSDDSEEDADDNYYADIRQSISETVRVRGQLSLLNGDYRMGQADLFYQTEDGMTDGSLGASYWGSFDANTRAYSPLYRTLGKAEPYSYYYARLTQQIAPAWLVSPGVSIRLADADVNQVQNNRDYQNYDLTLIYQPNRSFNASLGAEYWRVDPGDSFLGFSGELRYRNGRIWEISGGAYYAQYTYDTYSDITYTASGGQTVFSESGTVVEESPYVKTYFIRGKHRLTKWLTGRGQFDVEDDDEAEDLAYRVRVSIEVRY